MLLEGLSVLLFSLSFLPQQNSTSSQAGPAQEGFQIAGVVVDASSGQPLSRAEVLLGAQGKPDGGQTTMTGEDGRFGFDNLAPGVYTLSARRKGYVQQAYKQHEVFSTAIIVAPSQDTMHLRFPLPREASIYGQIVDERNDPVRNGQVILFERGLRGGRRATWQRNRANTDDEGHYRFGHLHPGTYFLAVSAHPWYAQHDLQSLPQTRSSSGEILSGGEIIQPDPALDVVYPITFFSNATDISGAVPITLHAGDAEIADLTLHPVPAVHVTVSFDPSGKPDEPENVWPEATQTVLEGWQEHFPTSSTQIRPGLMEITGIPPGSLNLTLHTNRGTESSARSLSLQLAADSQINMSQAAANATVSGVVKMDDGSPVLGGFIQFHNRNTSEAVGEQTGENGEFVLRGRALPAGTYDVTVGGSSALAVKSLSATGAKVSGRGLEVSAGQEVKLTVTVSRGTGRITGVALKDDKPVDGVMVVLVPEVAENNLDLFRRDQSDSDGTFNLNGILPGKYTVIALENGWDLDWYNASGLKKYLASGERVEVTANAKIQVKVKVQPAVQ